MLIFKKRQKGHSRLIGNLRLRTVCAVNDRRWPSFTAQSGDSSTEETLAQGLRAMVQCSACADLGRDLTIEMVKIASKFSE